MPSHRSAKACRLRCPHWRLQDGTVALSDHPVRLPPLHRSKTTDHGTVEWFDPFLASFHEGEPPLCWASPAHSGSMQQVPSRALPILSRNNASEQPLCGSSVVAMSWMVGCTAVSERLPVLGPSVGLRDGGCRQQGITPWTWSRRCSRRSWCSAHAADADDGLAVDLGLLLDDAGVHRLPLPHHHRGAGWSRSIVSAALTGS